jgi:hypothetical protein
LKRLPDLAASFRFEVMMDAEIAAAAADKIAGMRLSPRRTHVAHAWLTAFPYAELQAEADRRGLHPDALTAKIVEKVVCRGLIDELLGP